MRGTGYSSFLIAIMLAYTFWHWRRPEITAGDYEARQRAFHHALAGASGALHGSTCLAITGAPWAANGGDAYEDWYVVGRSADLDDLNTVAISASRAGPHDAAAAAAAGGTAGLYTLRFGQPLGDAAEAWWFAKPDGMRYDVLFSLLEPLARSGTAALWMRYMVLGPSPEFCVRSAAPLTLPSPITARRIEQRSVVSASERR